MCCGDAPKVRAYDPDEGTCSASTNRVIYPSIEICQQATIDMTFIIDTSNYNEYTFSNMTNFVSEFVTAMGVEQRGDRINYNFVSFGESPVVHGTQLVSLYAINDIIQDLGQSASSTRNLGNALHTVKNYVLSSSRPDTRQVFVIFTGGPSTDAYEAAAHSLQADGYVYAVGIGANAPSWSELQAMSTVIDGQFSSWKLTDDKLNIADSAAVITSRLCTAIPKCAGVIKEIVFVVEHDGNIINFNKTRDFVKSFATAMNIEPARISASLIVASDTISSNSTLKNKLNHFINAVDNTTSDYFETGFTLDQAVNQAVFMEGRRMNRNRIHRDIVIISSSAAAIPVEFNGTVFQISLSGATAATAENTYSANLDNLASLTQSLGQAVCTNVIDSCTTTPVDITVLMDSSGSLGRENFIRNIEYLKDLAASFQLSAGGAHLSVAQYSSAGLETLEVPFTYNLNDVVDGLNAAEYQDGFTHTGQAMAWTWNNVMNAYQRSGNHVLIVMTDGRAMDPDIVEDVANIMKGYARIYAIGVGDDVDRGTLRAIATNPEDLTTNADGSLKTTSFMADYSSLAIVTDILGDEICSGSFADV